MQYAFSVASIAGHDQHKAAAVAALRHSLQPTIKALASGVNAAISLQPSPGCQVLLKHSAMFPNHSKQSVPLKASLNSSLKCLLQGDQRILQRSKHCVSQPLDADRHLMNIMQKSALYAYDHLMATHIPSIAGQLLQRLWAAHADQQ